MLTGSRDIVTHLESHLHVMRALDTPAVKFARHIRPNVVAGLEQAHKLPSAAFMLDSTAPELHCYTHSALQSVSIVKSLPLNVSAAYTVAIVECS